MHVRCNPDGTSLTVLRIVVDLASSQLASALLPGDVHQQLLCVCAV